MARKTAKQRKKEEKIALLLVGVLVVAALAAAMLASPEFSLWLQRVTGIIQADGPPAKDLWENAPASVHIIDVGQGDAALVCSGGEYALIDAGTPEAAGILVEYLRLAGVQSLKYVVMTHPHSDHIGGMEAVIESFAVETVILPDLALAPYPTTSLFEGVLQAMLDKGTPGVAAAMGAEYPLGGGKITVVHAGLETQDNYNLLSLGLLFEGGGMRFLNTGDGEKQNEAAMLESGQNLGADVFMAGHHGSNTSNTADFVRAANPRLVLVSCGRDNSYGHPHETALASYSEVSAQVLRTDEAGSILMWRDEGGALHHAVTGAA